MCFKLNDLVKVYDYPYLYPGQMFSVRIGKRQNYKQQQRKRMPLDLKSMYKIVEAGNEKEKPRDKVIRDEARRFAQTELKFTIPNISTNMNLIEEVFYDFMIP